MFVVPLERYRAASELAGLPDYMKQYADRKRWDAHDQSRVLSSKIDTRRSHLSKSTNYSREMSKTSDYGSMSDTSCSPMT